MTRIKICGITNKIDAVAAAELGVDMLGFIFYKRSERCVEPRAAEDIVNELPAAVMKVGVFVDEDMAKVREIAENSALDVLQFHGDETPGYCAAFSGDYKIIKAFRIKDKNSLKQVNSYDVDFLLFDSYKEGLPGGTGKVFDWRLLRDFEILRPFILSGGLTQSTVASAIREVAPYGVDVASGVEKSPGKKDLKLMKSFVEEVRKSEKVPGTSF